MVPHTVQERQRSIVRAQYEKEDAGRLLAEARKELAVVRGEVEDLAARQSGHTGDLLQPDFDALARVIAGGDALLEAGDSPEPFTYQVPVFHASATL